MSDTVPTGQPDAVAENSATELSASDEQTQQEQPESRHHLIFGAAGLATGLLVGLITGLAAAPIASAINNATAPQRIPEAVATCDVEDDLWIIVGDDGASPSLQSEGSEAAGADIADIACVLTELDIPDSVTTRIDSTRALDGRQSAEWDEFSASWGYHPDNGLDMVIETVDQ